MPTRFISWVAWGVLPIRSAPGLQGQFFFLLDGEISQIERVRGCLAIHEAGDSCALTRPANGPASEPLRRIPGIRALGLWVVVAQVPSSTPRGPSWLAASDQVMDCSNDASSEPVRIKTRLCVHLYPLWLADFPAVPRVA